MREFDSEKCVLIFLLLVSSIANATEISGQISDATGGIIAGARIRAMQADRAISEATADASGRYVLAWEKLFLEGDQRYKRFLLQQGPLATEFITYLRELQ